MPGAVVVEGLRDLDVAFGKFSKGLQAAVRAEELKVADPVKVRAERHAVQDIRNIGLEWSSMRIGVTSRNVYVAPAMRRRRGSPRPNLAGELLEAMQQGLDESRDEVVAGFESMLAELKFTAGF